MRCGAIALHTGAGLGSPQTLTPFKEPLVPDTPSRLNGHMLALRNRHFFGFDVLLLLLTPALALALRTDGLNVQPQGWNALTLYVPGLLLYTGLALVVRLAVFYRFGLYSRFWRYASIEELDQISWAVLFSTAILLAVILVARTPEVIRTGFPLWNFPRSVVLIDGLLTLALIGGTRFSVRLATHRQKSRHGRFRRVVVMGAGDAGSMIVREMQRNPALAYGTCGLSRRRCGQTGGAYLRRARLGYTPRDPGCGRAV